MGARKFLLFISCLLALGSGSALAHKGSDAYLDVQQVNPAGPAVGSGGAALRDYRFLLAVAIKDLDLLLPIDANADGKVTWGETKAARPLVEELLNEAANTELPAGLRTADPDGASGCRLTWQLDGVDRRSDGVYLRMVASARCPVAQTLAFHYRLFRNQDASHRLLVAGRIAGQDLLTTTSPQQATPLLLSPGAYRGPDPAARPLASSSSRWFVSRDYFSLGVHHLLEGYDHLAFLLALVLPLRLGLFAAAPRALPAVAAVARGQAASVWWVLLRTVTAFTIGHSITLMLATFGWTQASPRWVEPAIALSIAVTALLNLRPLPWLRTDVLALLFGLVHGYGFAGLLLEAAAPTGLLPWALAGFNVGVEAGQLLAVSGWVLLSQALVGRRWYPGVVVRGGSVLLVLLAVWWFWQRVG
ncbi:HupE/UreJ family protein [Rhodoferax ferrireducens]|uniref:HupE/UreJ family protein n=1 Tax=Rhodoferax ferrireducens TaxID=192843 RepID=UPI000E0DB73C|nr:HupE/UreJ family protein [Rhodoferax ferrireducens]